MPFEEWLERAASQDEERVGSTATTAITRFLSVAKNPGSPINIPGP